MANFFNYFPKTAYISDKKSSLTLITNLLTRVKFLDAIKNNVSAYYLYSVKDGETPENLAFRFYGSMERHWVILLLNDIRDPQFDWCMNYETFNRYVEEKYSGLGGLTYAQSTVQKYLIDETRAIPSLRSSVTETRETDYDTWNSFATSSTTLTLTNSLNYTMTKTTSKRTQTIYDYEIELNEAKRSIKVLKKEYVDLVEKELKNIGNITPVSAV
jgi:type II secretory pathway component GspD/PulD (secretin)